ncbi:M15 family metallopeptidase [Nonomuraea sp. NPDC050663]|uniref:M15 family metallopeptidase n=1 Tax=Nonomuraea sp. NPDC050663 TaxID=3364370 RepID=UPI00378D3249
MVINTATTRARRLLVVGVAAIIAVIAATLAWQLMTTSAVSLGDVFDPRGSGSRSQGADGAVPDKVSVFDDELAAVAKLDPDLLAAVRHAAADAEEDGVEFNVNSGWRSEEYQERLLEDAITEYGSPEEAARWVATPDKSAHVSGDAIDIGPAGAAEWLSRHGGRYGLCQIYRNEPWHYELRPKAVKRGCPAMYADPTEDPRITGSKKRSS